MKIKIISIAAMLGLGITINGMDHKDTGFNDMLLEGTVPSLKFHSAWKVAQGNIPEGKAPEEVLEYVNKIKAIQACDKSSSEKKLFINLLNNPDISDEAIKKFFPKLIKKYLGKQSFTKENLLNSILFEASKKGKAEFAQLSIQLGAYVNAKNHSDLTSLIYAALYGRKEIICILLKSGVNANVSTNGGWSPLMIAVDYGYKEIVQLLLDYGADINARKDDGLTAPMIAVSRGNREIVQILLDHTANADAKNLALMRAVKKEEK